MEIPRPSSPNASEALDSGSCPQEFWHQNPETVSPCDWVNGSPLCILLSSQEGQNKPEQRTNTALLLGGGGGWGAVTHQMTPEFCSQLPLHLCCQVQGHSASTASLSPSFIRAPKTIMLPPGLKTITGSSPYSEVWCLMPLR